MVAFDVHLVVASPWPSPSRKLGQSHGGVRRAPRGGVILAVALEEARTIAKPSRRCSGAYVPVYNADANALVFARQDGAGDVALEAVSRRDAPTTVTIVLLVAPERTSRATSGACLPSGLWRRTWIT
jgi:hypothetical protein